MNRRWTRTDQTKSLPSHLVDAFSLWARWAVGREPAIQNRKAWAIIDVHLNRRRMMRQRAVAICRPFHHIHLRRRASKMPIISTTATIPHRKTTTSSLRRANRVSSTTRDMTTPSSRPNTTLMTKMKKKVPMSVLSALWPSHCFNRLFQV